MTIVGELSVVTSRHGGGNGLPYIYLQDELGAKRAAIWGSAAQRFDLAYLLAAAPDLYAALSEAEGFIARSSGGGETDFRTRLQATLAKARGEPAPVTI